MRYIFAVIVSGLLAVPVLGDGIFVDGNKSPLEGTAVGIRGGKFVFTIRGTDRQYELEKVDAVTLDGVPKFAEAEAAREKDAKAAVALYKQIIPTINKPELKQYIQWRAIGPTDEDGRWGEAVALFLEVYQGTPTDFVWNGRPNHMPAAGSALLTESAEKVSAAAKVAKNEDVRKNLKLFLLDIYNRAGNTDAATRLAREISTGIVEEAPTPVAARGGGGDLGSGGGVVMDIENAIRARNFDVALLRADAQLANATGETAVQLFTLKAQALEGRNEPENAVAALLRIPAHYPDSAGAPAALLRAADLNKQLNRADAAKALYREIVEKYPTSKEAGIAKGQ